MGWNELSNKQKIREVFEYLISKKTEVSVRIKQEKGFFATKVLKFTSDDPTSKIGKKPEIVIEKLVPDRGNTLIQSFPDVGIEFTVNLNQCRCSAKFKGISSEYPFFGLIVGLPESIEVMEKRKEERVVHELPDFVSVEFTLPRAPSEGKVYSLSVIDSSFHGLGILLTKKDFDLLNVVKPGDLLKDITFYAPSAIIKVEAVVRHISRVDWGKNKGSYILGVESQEIIESSKQDEK